MYVWQCRIRISMQQVDDRTPKPSEDGSSPTAAPELIEIPAAPTGGASRA